MKKFYFLNPQKQWEGPYRYHKILWLALKGTVKPFTYLWHNKFAEDIGDHPLASIYARKRAGEFSSLPVWVFGYNILAAAANVWRKIKSAWGKERKWRKFLKKPIQTRIPKDAIKINLVPSIVAIHDFAAPDDFKVKLVYLDSNTQEAKISEYPIILWHDKKPGIRFAITMNEPPNVGGVEYKESYGLHSQLGLIGENDRLMVARDSVFDFHTRFPFKPQILTGRFKQANLICAHEYKNVFNRLIIKVEDDKMIGPLDILEYTGWAEYDHDKFNVHPSLMGISFKTGGGHAEVKVGTSTYLFYDVEGNFLIIDGLSREDLETFKQKAEAIRTALALMSGKFYGGICSYVTSGGADFTDINGVWYELEKESVQSGRRIIDRQLFNAMHKEDMGSPVGRPVTAAVFSALCSSLWEKEQLMHAAKLVVSAMGNTDPLQQGALYSVALETLTNELGEPKSKDLKPIQDKTISEDIIKKLTAVVAGYNGIISNESAGILQKKISDINNPTNKDKLVKTFGLYGIALTELDHKTIGKRNDYLHGRNPLGSSEAFELTQISLRLHTLITALLLKSVGYSGNVINLDVHSYVADEARLLDTAEKQNAVFTMLVEEIERAARRNNEQEFEAAKNKLSKEIENSKLTGFLRVI